MLDAASNMPVGVSKRRLNMFQLLGMGDQLE
jgi:hypothetical protein